MLADRLNCVCPTWAAPAFGIVGRESGLPCVAATPVPRSRILGYARCEFRDERGRPDGLTAADPGHGPNCHPWLQSPAAIPRCNP